MEVMPKAPGRGAAPQPVAAPPARPKLNILPHVWRVLALWTLVLLAYANSFRAGMTLDNATIILQDTRLQAATSQNVGLIFSQEYWYGNGSTNLYRPLTTLSYLFNYSILGDGPNPAGYHAINLALHALNVLLVYLLGLAILRQTGLALGLAGLWGVHPILTESVTNIVGRADLLAAFGVLAALFCHIQSSRSTGRKRAACIAGIALAAAIGMFSKESAIVVLAVLPLYDWLFGAGDFRKHAAGYAALLPGIAAFFYFRAGMLAHSPLVIVPFVDNPLNGASFLAARLTAVRIIGKEFLLCLWPAALSCDYSYNQIPIFAWSFSWPDLAAVLSLIACAAAAIAAFRYRRRAPAMAFFVAFWFVTIAPTANIAILIGSIMAERFLYLPSIAVAGCLVMGIAALANRFSATPAAACKVAAVAVGVISLACAVRTVFRNNDWRDQISIWRSAVETCPRSFKAHTSYAVSLAAAGVNLDTSVREADRALAILSTLPDNLNNSLGYNQAGFCYRAKGQSDPASSRYWYTKARDVLLQGIKIDRLGVEQARQLNFEAGKGPYAGGQARLYMELGRVYLLLHQPKDAAAIFGEGRMINTQPEFTEAISQAYRDSGDRDAAAISLIEGIVLDPNASTLAADLVKLYRDLPPGSCAVTQSGGSFSINMECPLVRGHLCTASANVAREYAAHSRNGSAQRTVQTAITQFGCPSSIFQ